MLKFLPILSNTYSLYKLIEIIKKDRLLQLILFAGLLIQLFTAITAHGFFHPDQHFQIIEFSSLQLHKESYAPHIWEYTSQIRPSLQVYIFSGYELLCNAIGITDPFNQLTLLRIIQSLIFLMVFNSIAIWYFGKGEKKVLYIVLILLNFSWFLPYSRTMFSSEITASLLFFTSFFYFHRKATNTIVNTKCLLFTGFMFALSFFLRFQLAFAIAGFGCWLLIEKKYQWIVYTSAGFILGVLFNMALDYGFYHQLVFTPYLYFKVNILEGKAATFGEQGITYYPTALLLFLTVPPLSAVLLFYYGKISLQQFKNPLVLSVFFLIAGHFFIGHKEERFMFPAINILPVIIGFGMPGILSFYSINKTWRSIFKPIIIFSVLLNTLLLITIIFTPYSQTVNFANTLNHQFKNEATDIYCLDRTPLETESKLGLVFYRNNSSVRYLKINTNDSLRYLQPAPVWLAATYNQIKYDKKMIDSLGYKPVIFSSQLLWNINTFLDEKKVNTINDIWVLYKKN